MKIRNWQFCFTLIAACFTSALTASAAAEFPDFLPTYYANALTVAGVYLERSNADGTSDLPSGARRASYAEKGITLVVESITCEPPRCAEIHQRALGAINKQASAAHGNFTEVEDTQFSASWWEGGDTNAVFAFELPRLAMIWTIRVPLVQKFSTIEYAAMLERLINRNRTEQASATDNVEFGKWDKAIYAHALALREQGDTSASLALLEALRSWVPTDYAAQMDYAEAKGPTPEARDSAQTVLDNAEDVSLTDRANRFLHRQQSSLDSLAIISPPPPGLQAVFVVLAPCNPLLVQDAATTFSEATGIPARVVRLGRPWMPSGGRRILFQYSIEQTIVQFRGQDVDFQGWTRDRYAQELEAIGEKTTDALTRFRLRKLAADVGNLPDQYDITPNLVQLGEELASIKTSAPGAVFVGVTALPLYLGTSNFVFSGSNTAIPRISILSYSMMLASTFDDAQQSRRRLVQRLAKEMVPATLRPLGVPRPADPSDPYSYADGLPRLDQKTLVLSSPTRQAIKALREKTP